MSANRLSGTNLGFVLFSARIAVLLVVIRGGMASAQTYTVLHNFDSAQSDGFNPQGSLALDASGNVWGTTLSGSTYLPNSAGTVFKFTPPGTLTTLYSFEKSDGTTPNGLTLGSDGNFYGTASYGGGSCTYAVMGCGTIFKVTPAGAFSLLYQFDGIHGAQPYSLVLGSDGNLYGVTFFGGTYNCGTFFEITPAGNFSVLYNFTAAAAAPIAPLAAGSNGTFYGATLDGGTYGGGVVFKITTAGQFSVLYNLHEAGNETVSNVAALTVGADGSIYGTALDQQILATPQYTYYCPTWCGTIFELTPQGEMSNLYNFSNLAQGGDPFEITQGIDGNLYGLAQGGAITPVCYNGCGVVFKVTPAGSYSILHNVEGTDGWFAPYPASDMNPSTLVQRSDGNFYGVEPYGGTGLDNECTIPSPAGCGVLFSLVVFDFSVTASAFNPGNVNPGGSASSTVKIAPVNFFQASVSLSCSVQPSSASAPQCSISPESVTPGTNANLTVATTGTTAERLHPGFRWRLFYALLLPVSGLSMVTFICRPGRGGRRKMLLGLQLVMLLLLSILYLACGGGSANSGTPSGTYKITVTANSGFVEHSATVNLVVQ